MTRGAARPSLTTPSPLTKNTAAVVLAGGKGTRLGALTRHECKPALPFGGAYRTIDFSLSNCVNSGIHRIGIATQYRDATLVSHITRVWHPDVVRQQGFIEPWRADSMASGAGYCGTADAVFQNWEKIEAMNVERVLILAGDHVYKMDYRPMLEQHERSGADVTVGCVEVSIAEASQFGVMSIDNRNRIVRFAEKPSDPEPLPDRPDRALGSMGIYVFSRNRLGQLLAEDARAAGSSRDFGCDIIPRLIGKANLCAYPFAGEAVVGGGYWRDVGTVSAYWRTHMELLDGSSGLTLNDADWPVWPGDSRRHDLPRYATGLSWPGRVVNALIAGDCQFEEATVHRSVLFEQAMVAPNASVLNAVILPHAVIGHDSRLSGVVVDAGVYVPPGTVIDATRRGADTHTPILITADTNFSGHASGSARRRKARTRSAIREGLQQTGTQQERMH